MKFKKNKARITITEFFAINFDEKNLWEYKAQDTDLLAELVNIIRPRNLKTILSIDLGELLKELKENEQYRIGLAKYLKGLLKNKKFSKILTDAGILTDADFIFEVKKRLFAKLIPDQPEKDTLEYLLNQVFYVKTDPVWIAKIPPQQIEQLFELLTFSPIYTTTKNGSPLAELLFALEVIIHRIAGRALETEVIQMVPEYENLESPFLAYQKEFALIAEKLLEERRNFITPDDLGYKQLIILHRQCTDYVKTAFKNSEKYGISLRVNQSLLRIRQQLERLNTLLPLLIINSPEEAKKNTITLAKDLIAYNCDKNNVRKLINESTELISYEVTQHTARTGEHYITRDRKEYFKMFWTASGGGFIVAILCIIKVFLSKMDTSAFGHAFFYSLNYSLGFIAIYVLGFTLATKQPAMTASALVSALEADKKKTNVPDGEKHKTFAELFARVFRSQFIAFVGNVVVAFPVALLGIWLIDITFDYNLALTKWYHLIRDLSPIHSLAIVHAAIAGVFLFLSGIIAGAVANRDKHQHIYYRIQEHPLLKLSLGRVRTKKLAELYEKKWAGIMSNLWFGVFMGSTASIGIFLGLDIDIRHITFASGNLALGLYGANWNVSESMLFWGIFGVGIIGLVNFSVSFGLSTALAFRSRNIPLSEMRLIARSIWKHFKRKPMSFFFPNFRQSSRSLKNN
ncbi:site-specific recombinase [Flavobacterium sp. NRK1]|uniref:site-specific recombinase n=1 Tax=Flavobacterium sp. NRK1 TaxID=2954929 RepID=UPI002091FA1D|nr:site-specific recombinase [Flavobacterium sp. NRK1]MCO6147455.1 site-specific recombinase [Flavobacterium sp. NRK1]